MARDSSETPRRDSGDAPGSAAASLSASDSDGCDGRWRNAFSSALTTADTHAGIPGVGGGDARDARDSAHFPVGILRAAEEVQGLSGPSDGDGCGGRGAHRRQSADMLIS